MTRLANVSIDRLITDVADVSKALVRRLRRCNQEQPVQNREGGANVGIVEIDAAAPVSHSSQLEIGLHCAQKIVAAPSKITSLYALNVRGNGGIRTKFRFLSPRGSQTANEEAVGGN